MYVSCTQAPLLLWWYNILVFQDLSTHFLNLFLITDSVPIIKHFSVSDGLTVVLSFQGVKTVLNNSMSGHKNRLFRLRIPYGRNWMKKL